MLWSFPLPGAEAVRWASTMSSAWDAILPTSDERLQTSLDLCAGLVALSGQLPMEAEREVTGDPEGVLSAKDRTATVENGRISIGRLYAARRLGLRSVWATGQCGVFSAGQEAIPWWVAAQGSSDLQGMAKPTSSVSHGCLLQPQVQQGQVEVPARPTWARWARKVRWVPAASHPQRVLSTPLEPLLSPAPQDPAVMIKCR